MIRSYGILIFWVLAAAALLVSGARVSADAPGPGVRLLLLVSLAEMAVAYAILEPWSAGPSVGRALLGLALFLVLSIASFRFAAGGPHYLLVHALWVTGLVALFVAVVALGMLGRAFQRIARRHEEPPPSRR